MSRQHIAVLCRNLRKALKVGDLQNAEQILGQLQQEDPLGKETQGLELELLLRSRRNDEALAVARRLMELFPDSPRILYVAGKAFYRHKDYQKAAELFRESHRIAAHWAPQHWLGKTLTQLGRYAEAEACLEEIATKNAYVYRDLAWLYERQGDFRQAIQAHQYLIDRAGEDRFAEQQIVRLKARLQDAGSFLGEMELLQDLGEEVPDNLAPEYVETLLHAGRGDEAREFVKRQLQSWDKRTGVQVAWVTYKNSAYDLAFELFVRFLEDSADNMKYLSALESAARKCGRIELLIKSYQAAAERHPRLYGRARNLGKRIREE